MKECNNVVDRMNLISRIKKKNWSADGTTICVFIEDVAKLGSKLTLLGVALEATRTTVAIWTLRIVLDNRLDHTPKRCTM